MYTLGICRNKPDSNWWRRFAFFLFAAGQGRARDHVHLHIHGQQSAAQRRLVFFPSHISHHSVDRPRAHVAQGMRLRHYTTSLHYLHEAYKLDLTWPQCAQNVYVRVTMAVFLLEAEAFTVPSLVDTALCISETAIFTKRGRSSSNRASVRGRPPPHSHPPKVLSAMFCCLSTWLRLTRAKLST